MRVKLQKHSLSAVIFIGSRSAYLINVELNKVGVLNARVASIQT